MKTTKPKWSKEIPAEEGLYWCRYRGKHGITIAPARVINFKNMMRGGVKYKLLQMVDVAWGGTFTTDNRTFFKWDSARFGPKIEAPEYP